MQQYKYIQAKVSNMVKGISVKCTQAKPDTDGLPLVCVWLVVALLITALLIAGRG